MTGLMEDFINRSRAKEDARIESTDGQGPQGSAAWLFERVGYVTASRFNDIIAKTKAGKPTAAREKYLWECVVGRLTGLPQDHYTSAALQWGGDQEIPSRMAAEAASGYIIEEVGFIKHPTIKWIGGSPDGLIGEDGGWESKSPYNSAVHLQTVLGGMPEEHMAQIQGLLWITGRKWWDYQSFDPRLPEPLNCFRQRIERDSAYIAAMAAEIIVFAQEVEALVARLADYKEAA